MATPTQDPHVVIEDQDDGWVVYRRDDGARWRVDGTCVGIGNCIIGAVIDVDGAPTVVRDHEHLDELRVLLGPRLGYALDSPVAPGFEGCCPLVITELEP